jgi:hypothetical protein
MIGVLRFDSRRGLGIFLFTTASRTALGPSQPPIQWVPGTLSLGVKRQGHEADHSPPSSAEVKNAWSYTSTPQYVFMAWCLVKRRDKFTLPYLTLRGWWVSRVVLWREELCCTSKEWNTSQRFEDFTAVMFHVQVFWVVTPCSVSGGYRRFGDSCCLHLQDPWNGGILPQHYTASQPRRPGLQTQVI